MSAWVELLSCNYPFVHYVDTKTTFIVSPHPIRFTVYKQLQHIWSLFSCHVSVATNRVINCHLSPLMDAHREPLLLAEPQAE